MTSTILFNESAFIANVINDFNSQIENNQLPDILTIVSNKLAEYKNLEEYAKTHYCDLNDLNSYLVLKIFEKLDDE